VKSDRSVLRLDRRLLRRRGWIPPEELEKEMEALPDAADKVAPPELEEAGRSEEGGSGQERTTPAG
jgi:hypothetical protein